MVWLQQRITTTMKAYKLSNGKFGPRPETRDDAVKLKQRMYDGYNTCPDCGYQAAKFTTTDNCMWCQRIKMEQIRWFSTHGIDKPLSPQVVKPISDVDWGLEIYTAVRLVMDNDFRVAESPCKKHGHVHLIDPSTGSCHFCKGAGSSRKQSEALKLEWYIPSNECTACGTLALKHIDTGECKHCGDTPTDKRETADSVMMRESPDMVLTRTDSIDMGFKVYRTGEPCRKGHHGWRYNSTGNCIDCLRGKE